MKKLSALNQTGQQKQLWQPKVLTFYEMFFLEDKGPESLFLGFLKEDLFNFFLQK